jgi:hypothetical protein
MRFIGERRALAAAVIAFFTLQFLLSGLLIDGPFRGMLIGLGIVYGTAFVAVVAGYFWGRWYALGLSFSGVGMAAMTLIRTGELPPVVLLIGISHAIIGLGLLGPDAATFYDGRRDWRERWRMDENAVNKLGKAVTRAGASLPYLIIAGLAPKEGAGYVLSAVALAGAFVGLTALLRMRTWGVFVLGAAAVAAFAASGLLAPWIGISAGTIGGELMIAPGFVAFVLATALLPFAAPVARYLRAR